MTKKTKTMTPGVTTTTSKDYFDLTLWKYSKEPAEQIKLNDYNIKQKNLRFHLLFYLYCSKFFMDSILPYGKSAKDHLGIETILKLKNVDTYRTYLLVNKEKKNTLKTSLEKALED